MTVEEEPLTQEEKRAIASLRRLAKNWPKTLWLFSASGSLVVMRYKDGQHATNWHGGMDQDYAVTIIQGIDNDGGDW